MIAVVVFYNIGWTTGRLTGKRKAHHEATLSEDLKAAMHDYQADVICLCECGEIEIGLDVSQWILMLQRICGEDCDVCHQSHYTSIVRRATVEVTRQSSLLGTLSPQLHHTYRKCQHLQVTIKR